jgi:hypothetical protein
MEYKSCGNPCFPPCGDQAGKNCGDLGDCIEGCFCRSGFVFDYGFYVNAGVFKKDIMAQILLYLCRLLKRGLQGDMRVRDCGR